MELHRSRRALSAIVLLPLCVLVAQASSLSGATLKAGVARADIAPPLGKIRVLSSGRIGTSARDPLYAKALVLEELCVPAGDVRSLPRTPQARRGH